MDCMLVFAHFFYSCLFATLAVQRFAFNSDDTHADECALSAFLLLLFPRYMGMVC